uniref:Large ribosomal subunit protein eL31 n=1 Tax=Otolemur garnettii TaxID=30611 RepID=H0XUT1_OTOGA
MAPKKKGGEKKGQFAINQVVTQEYTIRHSQVHLYKFDIQHFRKALEEIWKFAMKEIGVPDVHIWLNRLNKTVWAKGIRNIPYRIHVRLSRKCNEDEDSPDKLYALVTYVPTTFKNLQSTWMRTN